MKTTAFVLSILSILSISATAEDIIADFISQEKTYTVRLADGQRFYGVEFRKWRPGIDWGHISYASSRSAFSSTPPSVRRPPNPGMAWINFNQVTSIQEVNPANDAADETTDLHFQSRGTSLKRNHSDESSHDEVNWFPEEPVGFGAESEAVVVATWVGVEGGEDHGEEGLEAFAVEALVGGEAGGALGAVVVDDAAPHDPSELPAVIKRFGAITTLREHVVHQQESLFAEGRASHLDIAKSRVALVESQINLAEAKGENDKVTKLLSHLIEIQRGREEGAKRQFAAGKIDKHDAAIAITEARIEILKTEIRLLKLEESE